MRPLYTSLAPKTPARWSRKLREAGVDYRISENGTTLLVPEQRVPSCGWKWLDSVFPRPGALGSRSLTRPNFGITDFAEHVNYRRAVEGELERSIMAIAEVQQARVHVTLPKESVFTESREPAKASVLVGLRAAAGSRRQNVIAITKSGVECGRRAFTRIHFRGRHAR